MSSSEAQACCKEVGAELTGPDPDPVETAPDRTASEISLDSENFNQEQMLSLEMETEEPASSEHEKPPVRPLFINSGQLNMPSPILLSPQHELLSPEIAWSAGGMR